MGGLVEAMPLDELLKHMKRRKRRKSTLPIGELKRRQAIRWQEYKRRSDARAAQWRAR